MIERVLHYIEYCMKNTNSYSDLLSEVNTPNIPQDFIPIYDWEYAILYILPLHRLQVTEGIGILTHVYLMMTELCNDPPRYNSPTIFFTFLLSRQVLCANSKAVCKLMDRKPSASEVTLPSGVPLCSGSSVRWSDRLPPWYRHHKSSTQLYKWFNYGYC